jgi:hypothetical protein
MIVLRESDYICAGVDCEQRSFGHLGTLFAVLDALTQKGILAGSVTMGLQFLLVKATFGL